MKKKVILTGSFGVGKTSLFNQFLYSQFSEKYLTTIGVKVDKKTVLVNGEEVILLLWDIAGEISQDKVPKSYFLGSSAILYVFDLTRPSTYKNMEVDMNFLQGKLPGVLVKIVGNKKDLVSKEQIEQVKEDLPKVADIFTSAKTGENVETLFSELAKELMDDVRD